MAKKATKNAFGAANRNRLIDTYFAASPASPVSAETAWKHVYRLLLWVDRTTGLAHCYESDKCQPGKPWYARSLAFHDWLSREMGAEPNELAQNLDWLFLRATTDLAAEVIRRVSRIEAVAAQQRAPYNDRVFPKPGEDGELIAIVKEVLGGHLSGEVAEPAWQMLVQRIRQYLSTENKRKNLVGEGFEDVLAHVLQRTLRSGTTDVRTRPMLQDLPGFARTRQGDKPNKVDVAVLRPNARTLVTAKWSVRADREKQFTTDFGDYVTAESAGQPFQYVFVTNEFDPARLMRACEKLAVNALMFSHVVHISTDALVATYGAAPEPTMQRVLQHINTSRLISLQKWIGMLHGA
jgi:hypothetical protein